MDCLSAISINVLGDTQLSCVRVYFEEGMCGLFVKAVTQRVEQRPKLRAVCICGADLKRGEIQGEDNWEHFTTAREQVMNLNELMKLMYKKQKKKKHKIIN